MKNTGERMPWTYADDCKIRISDEDKLTDYALKLTTKGTDDVTQVDRLCMSMNWKNSSLLRPETAHVPAVLENLQFISVVFGDLFPKQQMYGKKSSSASRFGRKCENGLEKFQFIGGAAAVRS
ncbi:hypothetical protein [Paenibacillus ferrarius]|uniref:hypothetical protein n=1 Tax=Paenibacillus ferrarius TaxID=1469647 RepID=UPI003D2D03B8